MELTREPPDLRPGTGRVFRASPLGPLVGTLVAFGVLAVGGFLLYRATELAWFFWLVLGPLALVVGGLGLLVAFTLLEVFFASLRPTNWLACVRRDGVHLNLRSYRNAHLGGDDPTVVFLPFRELTSVARVVDVRIEDHGEGPVRTPHRSIALRLADPAASEDLEIACWLERTREAPTTTRFGIGSRTRHHDVTVFVPAPGEVRVQWHRGLLAALAARLPLEEARRVDLEAELEGLDVEERARRLLVRGELLGAIQQLVRHGGRTRREARDWIRAERERAA